MGEWRQAVDEEQKVRLGGGGEEEGGRGRSTVQPRASVPATPQLLQPFMTQSPCDPPTAHHTTLVILFLRETTQSEAWVDFARHYGTVFAPH